MSKTLPNFVGVTGLPRAGSTLLCQLLSQHPDIQCDGRSSALANLLLGIRRSVSEDSFFLSQLDQSADHAYSQLSGAMKGFLRGWCGGEGKSVVVDARPSGGGCHTLTPPQRSGLPVRAAPPDALEVVPSAMTGEGGLRRKDWAVRVAAAVVAGWLASVGAAHAQTCSQQGDAAARCRLVLSAPRAFTVRANTRLVGRRRRPAYLALTVNGAPCRGIWYSTTRFARTECRVTFPATTSVIEVLAYGDGVVRTKGVDITLIPDDRLSSLPREAGDLYPKTPRRKLRLPSPPALPSWPFTRKAPRPPPEPPPQASATSGVSPS